VLLLLLLLLLRLAAISVVRVIASPPLPPPLLRRIAIFVVPRGIPCGVSWGIPCESHIPQRTPGGSPGPPGRPSRQKFPGSHTRTRYERRDKIAHMHTQFALSLIFPRLQRTERSSRPEFSA
jgi:hypothetical protein